MYMECKYQAVLHDRFCICLHCSKLKQRSLFTSPELMSTSSIDAEVKVGIKSDTVKSRT